MSVPMPVVHIGRMRMAVLEPAMLVGVGVRLARRVFGAMSMPVMLVVHVGMRVRHGLVDMLMFVAFGEMKPDARRHEAPGHKKLRRNRLSESDDRNDRAEKRSSREISTGPSRSEMPKRNDKQRKTYAVAKKTDEPSQQRD